MSYNKDSIKVLEGLDAVRVRPGMYIGSTGPRGVHHLLWEVIDNSIDEALAGHCNHITVTLHADDFISVEDNGRGIPIDNHSNGLTTLEVVMTKLHAGGKFDNSNYQFSGGLHGVGISVVNALSELTNVEIKKNGKIYTQTFKRGEIASKLQISGSYKGKHSGTKISFKPDALIFGTPEFNATTIKSRLQELSYLNKNVKITFINELDESTTVFESKSGIIDYLTQVVGKRKGNDIVYVHDTGTIGSNDKAQQGELEFAFTYVETETTDELSFVNNIRTVDHGTHVSGFRTGLTKVINDLARSKGILKDKESNLNGNDIREGLIVILCLKMNDPQFESQTKDKLGSIDVTPFVSSITYNRLKEYLDTNPKLLNKIVERVRLINKAKLAAKLAKESIMNKNNIDHSLPGKLGNCTIKNPSLNELFLVEGDSAGGSAKQGRDRRYQAILPLKGKVLNVEKADVDQLLNNQELKDISVVLGCGAGENFRQEDVKFHKIIVMTDADVDGDHVSSLLLTFLYKRYPELFKLGYVYMAQPPLFKVEYGNKEKYCLDDKEKDAFCEELKRKGKKYTLERYKGLGEMDPEQLWETTMNPETRTLLKVNIKDFKEAEQVLKDMMGSNMSARKEFIEKYCNRVKLEDIL